MGYEIPDSAVIPRKKLECRLLPLIGICFCTILSVLLVMAICDRRMFDRVINGPLSELETNLKQNIRQSMELRWETFRVIFWVLLTLMQMVLNVLNTFLDQVQ